MSADMGITDDGGDKSNSLIESDFRPFMDKWEIAAIEQACSILDRPLSVLEWGSGNSTIYFSARLPAGSQWDAVEHNRDWALQVTRSVRRLGLSNIRLHYVANSAPYRDGVEDGDYTSFKEYILFPLGLRRKFDLILVDGRARVECLLAGWEILKDDGIMMLHDAERSAYSPGIPPQATQLRMTNPFLPGGRSVLFMARDPELLLGLAKKLDHFLPETIMLASNDKSITPVLRNSRCMCLFADHLHENGDTAAALSVLQQAIDIDPDSIEILNKLGMMLAESGHVDAALSAFQLAREIDPDHRLTIQNAARVARQHDRVELAAAWIEDYLLNHEDESLSIYLQQLRSGGSIDKPRDMEPLGIGSDYGGWYVLPGLLDKDSIVYSVGIGEDISFDLGMIERFGVTVHAFDPTPKSVQWLKKQSLPHEFVAYQIGLLDYDGTAQFNLPANPDHVSCSVHVSSHLTKQSVQVEVRRISSLMEMLGHKYIDLLKMDIEGAEYSVLADLLSQHIYPRQLLIEFHHRFDSIGDHKTLEAINALQQAGYTIFHHRNNYQEVSFRFQGEIPVHEVAQTSQIEQSWAARTATVLVVFNRPAHTRRVVDALRGHRVQNLIVLCDAARNPEQYAAVHEVRSIIASIDWTTPQVVYQKHNQGLAKSVVQGVDLAMANFDAVILLEDDCVPQEHFFRFVYQCLENYQDDTRVYGISGYSIPISEDVRSRYPWDIYFFPRMGSWGWATWKSRWLTDNRDLAQLTQQALDQGIDLEQGGSDVPDSIGDVLQGRVRDTWTLPWLLNVYLHQACYIYPTISHIENIGLDGTGVHCGRTDKYRTELAVSASTRFPPAPIFDAEIAAVFRSYQTSPQRRYSDARLAEIARHRPLRVLHICTHDNGGAGIAAMRLHNALRDQGVASSMLVVSKATQDADVYSVGDIGSIHARWRGILAQYPKHRHDLELFSDALSDLDLSNFDLFRDADIVNLHWVAGMVDHARLNQMLAGKPAVWTLHDMNAFTGGCHYTWECEKYVQSCKSCPQLGSTRDDDAAALGFARKRDGYRYANLHIVCPSRWLAGEVHRSTLLGGFPIQVIANGLPLDVFQSYPQDFVRSQLGIAADRKVVLFGCESLANIRKGFSYLLEAMEFLVRDGGEPPLFCFFGHQPQGLHFPGEIMPLGSIKGAQALAAVYSLADVLVIPSLQDNLPNVVPESFACGTPVAGFRVGGIPEIVEHLHTGYLVEPRDSQGLATGIRWVLDHVDSSMRNRCRLVAESLFGQPAQAASYLQLYRHAIAQPRPQPVPVSSPDLTSRESLPVLVNLGCGQRFHPAWRNFDFSSSDPAVQATNLRLGVPMADAGADAVYHSHVLEHFPKSEASGFIAECSRILKPGGVLRIAVPDLEVIARLYLDYLDRAESGESDAEDRYDWMVLEMLDQLVRNRPGGAMLDWWTAPELKARDFILERAGDEVGRLLNAIRSGGQVATRSEPRDPLAIGQFRLGGEVHQWMYDRFSLARLLRQHGFVEIHQVMATESAIPDFSTYQLDSDEQGRTRKPDSLFLEARKPGGDYLSAKDAGAESCQEKARTLCQESHAALARGDVAAAMLGFIDAIELDPVNLDALNQLAVISWDQGKTAEALGLIEHARAIAPDDPTTEKNFSRMSAMTSNVESRPAQSVDLLPIARQTTQQAGYRVTAVVSTYNSARFIAECLEDLIGQTIADQIEIFVLDAASPQNEQAVVERFQETHSNIRYLRTPERIGVYAAWNVIAREARGQYLVSCSTNDRLANTSCEVMADYLDAHPDVALVYGNSFLVDRPHQSFERHINSDAYVWPPHSHELLTRRCLVGPHPMWRRSLHAEVGYFDESYTAIGDQDFWLRVGYRHEIRNICVFTGLYYVNPKALSRDEAIAPDEIRRAHSSHLPDRFRRALTLSRSGAEKCTEVAASYLVVVLCMRGEEASIADTLDSLVAQSHDQWHFAIISDQAAPDPIFKSHPRLTWVALDGRGMQGAVQPLLHASTADWIVFAEPGLTFEPHALGEFALAGAQHPHWHLIYSDDADRDIYGSSHNYRHKPEFNLALMQRMPYLDNFAVRRKSLLRAGGVGEHVFAENFDIALRIHDQEGIASIGHIPAVLLRKSWDKRRPFHIDGGKAALCSHYQRSGMGEQADDLAQGLLSSTYQKALELLGEQCTNPNGKTSVDQGVPSDLDFYALWQRGHSYQKRDALWFVERMDALPNKPRFHLAVIVPPGREDALANNIRSLGHQFYPDWHLSIIASIPAHEAVASMDSITWRQASPEALLQEARKALLDTTADWIGLFEAGDKLAPHALFAFAEKAARHPEWRLLYSDEDSVDADDEHSSPFFKTDFNLEMLRAAPFTVGGLLLLRHDLFAELNGYDLDLTGVETFDLILRAWERIGHAGIGHLADILYHRHGEGGHGQWSQEVVAAAHRRALAAHYTRLNLLADLDEGDIPGTIHVHYPVVGTPLVSILIPVVSQVEILKRCLTSLIDGTGYSNCEILLLSMGSAEPEVTTYLADLASLNSPRLRVLDCPADLIESVRLGAIMAQGDYLLFFSDACAVLHEEWLGEMLGMAQQEDVGAVGAKLLSADGTLRHAGILFGIDDAVAGFPYRGCAIEDLGYFGRAGLVQELSAVSAACMLVRKSVYQDFGGIGADFGASLWDMDFCLRLRSQHYRVLFTPHSRLLHDAELKLNNIDQAVVDGFVDVWRKDVAYDPAYNRNLSTHGTNSLIEIAPALAWDPEWRPRPRILAHPADRTGCGEYRIISPMRALNDVGQVMGWETGNYLNTVELLRLEPDAIILQRQMDPSQLSLIGRYLRHSKAFRVFEIDDLITNVPVKSAHKKRIVEQKDLHKRFRKAISLCDRFVVSTEFLAEQYQGYSDDIVVVQNYIERQRWGELRPIRRHGEKARVGWAGGSSHDGDLAIIADVVKATAQEVDWVFFGMCPDSIRPYVAEFHKGVVLEEYPAKLASLDLDLAVAPLEDVPFNHGKSHLRLLEYGVLGYPVICTDITPYRGDYPVTRVPSKFKDWVEAIRAHVADRDGLARRGDALRDYIQERWMLEDHLDVWTRAWLP